LAIALFWSGASTVHNVDSTSPMKSMRRWGSFVQFRWRNQHFLPIGPHLYALAPALATDHARSKRRNFNLIRVVVCTDYRLVMALWIVTRYDQPAHTKLTQVAERHGRAGRVLRVHPSLSPGGAGEHHLFFSVITVWFPYRRWLLLVILELPATIAVRAVFTTIYPATAVTMWADLHSVVSTPFLHALGQFQPLAGRIFKLALGFWSGASLACSAHSWAFSR
jgi:hypothetical protein